MLQSNVGSKANNIAWLLFRVGIAVQLVLVHGLKKLGIGVETAEIVPNPFNLPESINEIFATGANIIMPLFIIFGLFARFASLPILAVTLTGYFIVHGSDPLPERDIPFMYSISFLMIAFLGAGKYSLDNYLFEKK